MCPRILPERDANHIEILIGRMAVRRDSNPIFSKALRVLGHARLFEPVRNLRHGPTRSRGAFNPHVDLIAERRKVGQKRPDHHDHCLRRCGDEAQGAGEWR
jgi:hypothetical protein